MKYAFIITGGSLSLCIPLCFTLSPYGDKLTEITLFPRVNVDTGSIMYKKEIKRK